MFPDILVKTPHYIAARKTSFSRGKLFRSLKMPNGRDVKIMDRKVYDRAIAAASRQMKQITTRSVKNDRI